MAGAPPSRFLQLAFCVAGIYAAYLVFSVLQESLFKAQPDGTTFTFTAFVLMVQCFFNLVVALILDWLQDGPGSAFTGNRQPTGYKWLPSLAKADVCFTAFVYVMAMFTSNESLKYVTYPTQTLAKSWCVLEVVLEVAEPLHASVFIAASSYLLCLGA